MDNSVHEAPECVRFGLGAPGVRHLGQPWWPGRKVRVTTDPGAGTHRGLRGVSAIPGGVVARAKITHQWADSSATVIEVKVAADYPDAVAEAVASVIRLWRETCVSTEDVE